MPITSTISPSFKVPIISCEVDEPLLTFKLSAVTVPHPIELGFVNVTVSILSKLAVFLEVFSPIIYFLFCSGSTWVSELSEVFSILSLVNSSSEFISSEVTSSVIKLFSCVSNWSLLDGILVISFSKLLSNSSPLAISIAFCDVNIAHNDSANKDLILFICIFPILPPIVFTFWCISSHSFCIFI